jgi:hypothetical protein
MSILKHLGIDLFISHGFYGKRRMTHLAVVHMGPQWGRIEVASWAFEGSLGGPVNLPALARRVLRQVAYAGAIIVGWNAPTDSPLPGRPLPARLGEWCHAVVAEVLREAGRPANAR